uniref:Zinc finger CCCH-type containing 13 n=1 Tax=Petromyzon marinus TaxID=7757 RepID=S4RX97_PETMA
TDARARMDKREGKDGGEAERAAARDRERREERDAGRQPPPPPEKAPEKEKARSERDGKVEGRSDGWRDGRGAAREGREPRRRDEASAGTTGAAAADDRAFGRTGRKREEGTRKEDRSGERGGRSNERTQDRGGGSHAGGRGGVGGGNTRVGLATWDSRAAAAPEKAARENRDSGRDVSFDRREERRENRERGKRPSLPPAGDRDAARREVERRERDRTDGGGAGDHRDRDKERERSGAEHREHRDRERVDGERRERERADADHRERERLDAEHRERERERERLANELRERERARPADAEKKAERAREHREQRERERAEGPDAGERERGKEREREAERGGGGGRGRGGRGRRREERERRREEPKEERREDGDKKRKRTRDVSSPTSPRPTAKKLRLKSPESADSSNSGDDRTNVTKLLQTALYPSTWGLVIPHHSSYVRRGRLANFTRDPRSPTSRKSPSKSSSSRISSCGKARENKLLIDSSLLMRKTIPGGHVSPDRVTTDLRERMKNKRQDLEAEPTSRRQEASPSPGRQAVAIPQEEGQVPKEGKLRVIFQESGRRKRAREEAESSDDDSVTHAKKRKGPSTPPVPAKEPPAERPESPKEVDEKPASITAGEVFSDWSDEEVPCRPEGEPRGRSLSGGSTGERTSGAATRPSSPGSATLSSSGSRARASAGRRRCATSTASRPWAFCRPPSPTGSSGSTHGATPPWSGTLRTEASFAQNFNMPMRDHASLLCEHHGRSSSIGSNQSRTSSRHRRSTSTESPQRAARTADGSREADRDRRRNRSAERSLDRRSSRLEQLRREESGSSAERHDVDRHGRGSRHSSPESGRWGHARAGSYDGRERGGAPPRNWDRRRGDRERERDGDRPQAPFDHQHHHHHHHHHGPPVPGLAGTPRGDLPAELGTARQSEDGAAVRAAQEHGSHDGRAVDTADGESFRRPRTVATRSTPRFMQTTTKKLKRDGKINLKEKDRTLESNQGLESLNGGWVTSCLPGSALLPAPRAGRDAEMGPSGASYEEYEPISDDELDEMLADGADGSRDPNKQTVCPDPADVAAVDWSSLANESKEVDGEQRDAGMALLRFTPGAVLLRLGVSARLAGPRLLQRIRDACKHMSHRTTDVEAMLEQELGALGRAVLGRRHEQAAVLHVAAPCHRALCYRRDLAIRRQMLSGKIGGQQPYTNAPSLDPELLRASLRLFKRR